MDRVEPGTVADERSSLEQWLDYHRDTLLWKCSGLSAEQLRTRAVPASSLSLLGLVRHMTEVERGWFRKHAAGEEIGYLYCSDADPDGDFDNVDEADAAADVETFRQEVAASRKAAAGLSLDKIVECQRHPHRHPQRDVRWIFQHMIEEYARHNGHADILRECIDGRTGD